MAHWSDSLPPNACSPAVEWARTQPDYARAWATCTRGDWMLWLVGRLAGPPGDDSRRPLVLAACECAELALPYAGRTRTYCEAAIQTAQAWARGDATIEEVRRAANAAGAAGDAVADAAYAAAYAAAAAAAYAAYAANAAAHTAAAATKCADIVRRHYPTPPRLP